MKNRKRLPPDVIDTFVALSGLVHDVTHPDVTVMADWALKTIPFSFYDVIHKDSPTAVFATSIFKKDDQTWSLFVVVLFLFSSRFLVVFLFTFQSIT